MGATKRLLIRAFVNVTLYSVEAFLAVLALLTALPVLLFPDQLAPTSIHALLPDAVVYLWGAGLLLGGSLTLAGIAAAQKSIERAGVSVLGGVAAVYAVALVAVPGVGPFFAIATYVAFALAMAARYWVIGREIRQIERREW